MSDPSVPVSAPAPELSDDLSERPFVRIGVYAWAFIGLALAVVVLGIVVARLSSIVIPAMLALFPAAVLQPPTNWLRARRIPGALAALIVLLATVGVIAGAVAVIAPQVAEQAESLQEAITNGLARLERFIAGPPFNLDLEELQTQAQEAFTTDRVTSTLGGLLGALVSGVTGLILGLILLFFYLKDGTQIADYAVGVFPRRWRADVRNMGRMAWTTIGEFIRGQLLVALIDAVGIGIGLVILRVPLALPLAILTFIGGLFPIVGASVAGLAAVLVALANGGLAQALLVVAVVVTVQQLEGNLLQPIILGRATALHPLAVIMAIAAGGFLLGVLGAFIAVPTAAAAAKAIGYLRQRVAG